MSKDVWNNREEPEIIEWSDSDRSIKRPVCAPEPCRPRQEPCGPLIACPPHVGHCGLVICPPLYGYCGPGFCRPSDGFCSPRS
jgi:hypothetical protein